MEDSPLSQRGIDAARLMETTAEGVWVIDASSNTAYVNGRMAAMLGYSPAEMLGVPLFAFMDEDGRGIAAGNVARRREGITEQHDFKFRRKDGGDLWVIITTNPILDDTGVYTGSLAMVTDITERKRMEEALHESEGRYRALAETVPQMVWTARPDGTLTYLNGRWREYTGHGLDAAAEAHGWDALVTPEERTSARAAWETALRTGRPYEAEHHIRAADGHCRWFLVRAVPHRDSGGALVQWVGTCTDVHVQKEAARAQGFLVALEDGMRQGADADDVLWRVVNLLGDHLDVSRCAFGEIDPERDTITVHRDYCRGAPSMAGTHSRAKWNEAAQGGIQIPIIQEGIQRATLAVQMSDGPRRWTPEEVALVQAVADRTWLAVENARLRRAEREQHRRTSTVLESIRDGFLSVDPQWRYTYVNQAAEELLGMTRAQMLGRTVWELFPDAAHSAFARAARRALSERVPVATEVFSARRDGWFEEHIYPAPDGLSVFFRDITPEKRAEAERREAASRERVFMREVLAAVTDGRLRLCDDDAHLPARLMPYGEPVELSAATLTRLRQTAAEAARAARLPDERVYDLLTAVGEAGMNAVVHAGGGIGRVYIAEGDQIQVWVEDQGAGIALETLPRATLEKGFTTAGTLGHGLKMMIETVDRLWLLTGPSGTTVVLEQDRQAPAPGWL